MPLATDPSYSSMIDWIYFNLSYSEKLLALLCICISLMLLGRSIADYISPEVRHFM